MSRPARQPRSRRRPATLLARRVLDDRFGAGREERLGERGRGPVGEPAPGQGRRRRTDDHGPDHDPDDPGAQGPPRRGPSRPAAAEVGSWARRVFAPSMVVHGGGSAAIGPVLDEVATKPDGASRTGGVRHRAANAAGSTPHRPEHRIASEETACAGSCVSGAPATRFRTIWARAGRPVLEAGLGEAPRRIAHPDRDFFRDQKG